MENDGYTHLVSTHNGQISKDVVLDRVCQMIDQVLERPVVCGHSLCAITKHGKHSQTSILNLLELELVHSCFSLSQVEHVEELATRVRGVAATIEKQPPCRGILLTLRSRVAVILPALELSKLHHHHFNKKRVERGSTQYWLATPAGGITPEWNQTAALPVWGMAPMADKTSGARHPAAPSIAQRPWMTSEKRAMRGRQNHRHPQGLKGPRDRNHSLQQE